MMILIKSFEMTGKAYGLVTTALTVKNGQTCTEHATDPHKIYYCLFFFFLLSFNISLIL